MELSIKLFADGADKSGMIEMYNNPLISGFTTNPTLMKKAGVKNYEKFARDILQVIKEKPVSFEVFSDDFNEMERQAREIASWGENVYIKIPITDTKGNYSTDLVKRLSDSGIKVNVTAIFMVEQVKKIIPSLLNSPGSYVSLFAGRIADAGIDPIPIIKKVIDTTKDKSNIEVLWASTREVFNIVQADKIGCDIITVTNEILKKLPLLGKDLLQFSLDTVKMFYSDAKNAGYKL